MMFVKMCGMTRSDDVIKAVALGVDAVGFIFAPSPRQLSIRQARELTKNAHSVLKVGVFVDQELAYIQRARMECGLDIIQLHGHETPDFCDTVGGRIFKALRVKSSKTLAMMSDFSKNVTFLLDAWHPDRAGGTGKRLNTSILDEIDDFSRIIIAGGIDGDAMLSLASTYQPFGFDLNSRIEKSPGVKDHYKMEYAMQCAKKCREQRDY